MKQINAFILSCLLACSGYSQSSIQKAEKMIAARQYKSAFSLLEKADPENQSPDIVILKTNILLDFFILSIHHELFALKDLEENETLLELRREADGDYEMIVFDTDSIIKNLLLKDPGNFELHYALGRYYLETHFKYGSSGSMPESVLLKNMEMHMGIAFKNGINEHWAAYGLAYAKLLAEDFSGSIPLFEKSTELKPDYPTSYYNLAYANLQLNRHAAGIKAAKKAYELYEPKELKADAARMVAISYMEIDSIAQGLEYFRLSDLLEPKNYYTLKNLLKLEADLDTVRFLETRKRFFLLSPESPAIYQDLYSVHQSKGWNPSLLSFYQEQIASQHTDSIVLGNLHLFSAVILKELAKDEEWPDYVELAETYFKDQYPPDHQVFIFMKSHFRKPK